MATNRPLATVLGFAYASPTAEFPVRSGPGTNFDALPFKAQKGWSDLPILDVQPDAQNTPNDNDRSQVYQWFKLPFPNGQIGWLRAHVVGIYGDCTAFGYGVLDKPTHAYLLRRQMTPAAQPAAPAATAPATTTQSAADAMARAAAQVKADTPASPHAAPAAPAVSGPAMAIINTQSASRTRTGPSTAFEMLTTIPRGTKVPILAVQQENALQRYRWFKVDYQGQQMWIREDNVTYEGDTTPLGLPADLYPAPMGSSRWWVRGFNMPPNNDPGIYQHDGWDLGAPTGEPILCGPTGGLVVKSFQCPKCTPERPSALMAGYKLGDPAVFSDEGWGFGYGNYIIVRYLHEQLPQSTRDALAARGFPGGHLFVMHAHLERRMAEAGAALAGGAQFAACGNTGNSEATHLHLEVRASREASFTHWANLRSGLMDPVVLFKR